MFTSKFSAKRPPDSGYRNVVTLLVWNRFYRKRIFAGLSSTRTGYCWEHPARAARFTPPVIHQQGRRASHAIQTPAAKSGVPTQGILAIQFTGNFIAT